jgi:aerobic carbon-monoxide dehydrogenase medium subunit
MKSFELVEPTTLAEALAQLDRADRGTRAIAGGTALMLMMKSRLFQPARLVSLHRLNGALREIQVTREGELSIGALTTLRTLERSPMVKAFAPVITRALRTLSNIRVRNAATVGGHLAHGDPHMDLPPILLTLGARVRAASTRGERWIDLSNLFVGYYETALEKDELIVELAIPAQLAGICTAYEKCTSLSADDWPAVGVAVWYRMESDVVTEARIAISAATERPVRAVAAERELAGGPAGLDAFARAADAAGEEVQTLADIRGSASYKREMVRVHVRRALERARQVHAGEAE